MSDKIYLGRQVQTLDTSPEFAPYSRVTINLDDGTYVTAGDDTGRTLELDCPWGTRQMAENLLASLGGFRYRPYEATRAKLDPAAELGDGITLNGFYSGIYGRKTTFGRKMAADIRAPKEEEIDHEYPYRSREDRKFTRKLKEVNAEFLIQAQQISAKVSQEGGDESFAWSLLVNGWAVLADGNEVFAISKNGAKVSGEIEALSGKIGGCVIKDGVLQIDNANIGTLSANKIIVGGDNGYITGNQVGNYTLSGLNVSGGSLSTYNLASGVNTSLGYANFSNAVFNNTDTADYISAVTTRFVTTRVSNSLAVASGGTFAVDGWTYTPSSIEVVTGVDFTNKKTTKTTLYYLKRTAVYT